MTGALQMVDESRLLAGQIPRVPERLADDTVMPATLILSPAMIAIFAPLAVRRDRRSVG